MRQISEREASLLQSDNYAVHFRVLVEDADGSMVDLTDYDGYNWVKHITIEDDIDRTKRSYTIEIKRNRDKRSFVTLMKDSPYNVDMEEFGDLSYEYSPLLLMSREFRIDIAIAEVGETVDEDYWREFERGFIEKIDFAGDPIRIECSCRMWELQIEYIREERQYGAENGVLAENVMENILSDNNLEDIDLYVPESPEWAIYPYRQRKEQVSTALQEIAEQIGWEVRSRYDDNDDMRISFFKPPRDPEIQDWTFSAGDYTSVDTLEMNINEIRNVVRVVFSNINKEDEHGNPGKRETIEKSDQESIDQFGEIFMEISEASTSQINTPDEAETLAENSLHDLKDPKANQITETIFFFPVQLHDYYKFEPNGVHYDREQFFGVTAYRHELNFEDNEYRTYLTVHGKPDMSESGNPIGLHRSWFRKEAKPGIARENKFFAPLPPSNLTTRTSSDGIQLRYSIMRYEDLDGFNVYCSNDRNFSADKDSIVASGRANQWSINTYYDVDAEQLQVMQPEETYYFKVKSYDIYGNLSDSSNVVNGVFVGRNAYTYNESPLEMTSGTLNQVVVTIDGLKLEYEDSEDEEYYTDGYRQTTSFDLSDVGKVESSHVTWDEETPNGTDITVEVSLDGDSWSVCSNNSSIPVLSEGMDVSDESLYFKFNLTTDDVKTTPVLNYFNFFITTPTTLLEGGVTEENIADGAVTEPKLYEDYTKESDFDSHKGNRGEDEHSIATDEEAGFMSSEDKEKLDDVEGITDTLTIDGEDYVVEDGLIKEKA